MERRKRLILALGGVAIALCLIMSVVSYFKPYVHHLAGFGANNCYIPVKGYVIGSPKIETELIIIVR